jgi:hypothetical protein
MERYFWLTVKLHGWRWLAYPGVLAIAALILVPPLVATVRRARAHSRPDPGPAVAAPATDTRPEPVAAFMAVAALLAFGVGAGQGMGFQYDARLMPLLASVPGLLLAAVQLARVLRGEPVGAAEEEGVDDDGPPQRSRVRAELSGFGLVGAYLLAVWLVGFHLASFGFVAWFLWQAGRVRAPLALLSAAVALACFHLLGLGFDLRWPPGVLLR